jgi:hypothetical protein
MVQEKSANRRKTIDFIVLPRDIVLDLPVLFDELHLDSH